MKPPAWSQKAQETLAQSPADEVVLETFEFRHPLFITEDNQPAPIRVVRDIRPGDVLRAKLERNAPVNGGQWVDFICVAFEATLPKISEEAAADFILTIDNTDPVIAQSLRQAATGSDPVLMIFRPYLASDLTTPQWLPPPEFTLSQARIGGGQIQARARAFNLADRSVPSRLYQSGDFPGLVR